MVLWVVIVFQGESVPATLRASVFFHCYAWFGGKLTKKIPKVAVKSYLCINIHYKFTRENQYQNMPHFHIIDETILVRSNCAVLQ